MERPASIAAARRSYTPDKAREELLGEWFVALVYRPLSFVVTPGFIRAGLSPTAVTLLGSLLALGMPLLAWAGDGMAAAWVGLLAVSVLVLDCVDGNMARMLDAVTPLGALADMFGDILYRVALYLSLGILVAGSSSGLFAQGAAIGLGAACLYLCARLLRVQAGARTTDGEAAPPPAGFGLFALLSGIDHLVPVLLVFSAFLGGAQLLLAWVLVYSLGDLLWALSAAVRRLR